MKKSPQKERLTKAAYAKRRGVSQQYIGRLVKLGVIPLDANNRIDPQKADQAIARYRDPARACDESYSAARTRKERALAELREIEVAVRRGELVEKVRVEREAFAVARVVRDSLLNIPSRCAGILAAETDQDAVQRILAHELTQCLEGLVDRDPRASSKTTR